MTDQTAVDRIPIARSVVYAVRGLPQIADEYNATRTIAPTQISLTYRAAEDSQLGRVHAYVSGWWMQDGQRVPMDKPVGRHFWGRTFADWPEWLAGEARLHDPDASAVPVGQAPAGRAAVLREAADVLDTLPADASSFDEAEHKYKGGAAAEKLRRMADETQQNESKPYPDYREWLVEMLLGDGRWGTQRVGPDREKARALLRTRQAQSPDQPCRLVRLTTVHAIEADEAEYSASEPQQGEGLARIDRADEAQQPAMPDVDTLAAALDGLHTLIATSSRDWQTYRVDAWLWAVLCGWDCEQAEHDDTCTHGALEETAAMHGWDDATVAKVRRYRAAVRILTGPAGEAQQPTRRNIQCSDAFWRPRPHAPHDWQQGPDTQPVHCPGVPDTQQLKEA